jgi:hypothetical protein
MNPDRRSAQLAAVIGTVLACYAGSATAIEFEFENGGKLNWNTTVSVGASWRAEDPSEQLFTRADGSLIGKYSSPLIPGTPVGPRDGLAGNHAAGESNLNYAKNDRFSTPFRVITDLEYKKGRFGALLRAKYWYDQALNQENVLVGSQANNFNGTRPRLGPIPGYTLCTAATPPGTACLPVSPPGQNLWPKGKLSDRGFEAEQQFENFYLLDAYVYGSFDVGNTDLQLRLGNQVINWGESIFIQGVNQINPIDVPAARRAGAELKEILLPVWAVYANWGFDFGSIEAFYQLQWNNTSVDACGTYFSVTSTLIGANPGACNSLTVVAPGGQFGAPLPGTVSPIIPQLGSQPFQQGASSASYIPAIQGREPSDSGQFGLAFRFPVEKIDTEIGLYAMNIHSRLPVVGSITGTNWKDLPAAQQAALTAAGLIGTDAYGNYWTSSRLRSLYPGVEAAIEGFLRSVGLPTNLESGKGFWEYPEDIQIYGISAATNLLSWSTSAELSYQVDVPVMANGNDILIGSLAGLGPYRAIAREVSAQSEGAYLTGYERFDKTQFQVNAVKTFSNILGAESLLVVGEIGSQWNNVPDYTKGGVRYGRGFMYGFGSGPGFGPATADNPEGRPGIGTALNGDLCSPTFSGLPVPVANAFYNAQPNGCRNDGYVTDVAWGYRLRLSADYNNVMDSGVTVTPSVFWAHDVEGVSMDPTFIEDRMTLGLGVKFNYNKKYVLDLNYVSYDNDNFDPLFDRDYYSAAVSVTF